MLICLNPSLRQQAQLHVGTKFATNILEETVAEKKLL
jgi:hypothetical protein